MWSITSVLTFAYGKIKEYGSHQDLNTSGSPLYERRDLSTSLERWLCPLALLPAYIVSSLELTIIASALPQISTYFDKFDQLNWLVAAFTLTSTSFIPAFGQLADTFGRHASLQFAVLLSLIGSVLCAVAPSWPVLLLGRSLQGIGVAGVENITLIILAEQGSLDEQASNLSMFQLLNGLGYSIGPMIGGHLAKANWRFCFVLCAVLEFVSLFTIFGVRNRLKRGRLSLFRTQEGRAHCGLISGLSTLDYGGIFLFTAGIGLIILALTWGGATFPWSSPAVISSLTIGLCCILLFGLLEYLLEPGRILANRFQRTVPMIPASLFREKDIGIICFISCSAGAAFYSIFYFISIYFTLVGRGSAGKAGLKLLYYVPGLAVGVYAARYCCNSWPGQTFWALFIGTVIEAAGIAAIPAAVKKYDDVLVTVMMAISGAGTGALFMPSNVHLAGMFPGRLSSAYSMVRFSLPFGGTLALTIMSSVFQNRLDQPFNQTSDSVRNATLRNVTATDILDDQRSNITYAHLPAEQEAIRRQTSDAVMWAFISVIPVLAVGVILSAFLGNVWVPKGKHENEAVAMRNRKQTHGRADETETTVNISPMSQEAMTTEMVPVDGTSTDNSPTNAPYLIHSLYLLYLLQSLKR